MIARVKIVPKKLPNTQYPILLGPVDTNTQYQYRNKVKHCIDFSTNVQLYMYTAQAYPYNG